MASDDGDILGIQLSGFIWLHCEKGILKAAKGYFIRLFFSFFIVGEGVSLYQMGNI